MRFFRFRLLLAGYLISSSAIRAQTPPPDRSNQTELLSAMIQAGAYADALTQFCVSNNPGAAARTRTQLRDWAQRNHWPSVQARLNADSSLQQSFNTQKKSFLAELNAHRFKTALACGLLRQELASPAHDPSLKYRAQLQFLDSAAPNTSTSNSPGASPPPPSTAPALAPAPQRPASPSTLVAGTTGEAAGLPPGEPVTFGSVTFTPPAGWQITKSTSDGALLQAATQHTKAVLLITEIPLNGDLRASFETAVRTHSPVTGLQFRYSHEGVTGSGSPMIQIRDGGTLRGSRERQNIDAVGVALGPKMLLALLVSGNWGGDDYGFRKAFEKMVSGWKLRDEKGPAWDPMHPPSPVGARSGLYFGSRMENQLNPLGGMDLMAVREYLVLLPTGQAFRALPVGGHVLDMDFAAECARLPHACGTYRIEDNRIDFTWRGEYGMVTRASSEFVTGAPGKTSVASFNGTRAFEVTPAHNLRISGRYTSTFASVGSTAFQSTSVVAQTFIRFSTDGTYEKSGFSGASFTGAGAAGTVQSRKAIQTGRYSLNGYTLTLTPSDGSPVEMFTAVFEEVSTTPKAVFVNDKAFLRNDR